MDWKKTGPEFAERFEHFAFDKVVNEDGQQLPGETRYLAILATLIGCGGVDAYEEISAPGDGKRRDAGHGEGVRLSGGGLPGLWPDAALPERDQRRVQPQRDCPSPARTGHDHHGEPAGKGCRGAGCHFRRPHEGGVEAEPHQPLAGGQLHRDLSRCNGVLPCNTYRLISSQALSAR